MTQLRPGVLFDVDGTLVDTNYLHTVAWAQAFTEAGEWAAMHAIHRLIGKGGGKLVGTILGHEDDAISEGWRRHYDELQPLMRPFPGAADLLRTLHGAGLAVVLATSAPKQDVDAIRSALDADDAVDEITSSDDADEAKPAPDIFTAAMEAGSIDPERCIAVGDSVWDVEAADAAGIGCVGVESGGFSRAELMEAGAMHVYRDVQQMRDRLFVGPLVPLLDASPTR